MNVKNNLFFYLLFLTGAVYCVRSSGEDYAVSIVRTPPVVWENSRRRIFNSNIFMKQGWRFFKCEDCELEFKLPTRDVTSHSSETCPRCDLIVFPNRFEIDESIPVDKHLNIQVPWNWNGDLSECCNAHIILDLRGADLYHCNVCGNACYSKSKTIPATEF